MSAARIACAVAVALAASHALAGGIQPARPNALLVVDDVNYRVLRVPLGGGEVTVFSPPADAQTNLLTSPRGIGVGSDGSIIVVNFFEATLVQIDPATGAQFPVEGLLSGPPAIGTLPRDVALNPRGTAPGFLPTLGIAAQGELHQVVRNAFDTTGSLLAPYPSPYDPYVARFVAARDPGTSDPIDYYVATDSIPALLRYEGATDTFTPLWTDAALDSIHGLDAPRGGAYPLVASFREEPCPSSSNGIKLFTAVTNAGGFEISMECPGPVAYDGGNESLYYVDARSNPQTVLGMDGILFAPFQAPVATLPSGTSAIDMTLARVPEPGGATLGTAALIAVAGLARAIRGRRRVRRIGLACAVASAGMLPAVPVDAALRYGDVLVVDGVNDRVLRVEPALGNVTLFSPPPAGENLLSTPSGIGVGPDGTIVVANESGSLVQIDPRTGAQTAVAGFYSGPPDAGVEPQDVAVNPREPSFGFEPSLYVGAKGELRLIVRSPLATDGTQLALFPPTWADWETHHVSAWAPSETDPIDVYASIAGAVLRYDGSQDAIGEFWTPPVGYIEGLDVTSSGTPAVGVAWRRSACPSSENGIYRVNPFAQPADSPWSTGGLVECPRGLAWYGHFDAYTLALGDPPRVIELDAVELFPPVVTQRVAATLPSGTNPFDLAVYVPEPAGALGGPAAALALAALARRSTRLAASGAIR